jgi:hypothetical protein
MCWNMYRQGVTTQFLIVHSQRGSDIRGPRPAQRSIIGPDQPATCQPTAEVVVCYTSTSATPALCRNAQEGSIEVCQR